MREGSTLFVSFLPLNVVVVGHSLFVSEIACIPTSLPLEFLKIAGINSMSDQFEAAWTYIYK
mgnify:CR=1 FL=1